MPKGIYLRTQNTRKILSIAKIGKPRGGNPINWKHSEESRLNMSKIKKGKKLSLMHRKSISNALKNKPKPKGENSPNWKYGSNRYFGKIANIVYREHNINVICEECAITEGICIHHRDENRKNNNIDNLQALCRSCHTKHHFQKAKEYVKQTD